MSRTPARATLSVVRGSTWEDDFTYTDSDGVAIDLTGYEARLQVWDTEEAYGTAGTPVLSFTTVADPDELYFHDTDVGKLCIKVSPADHTDLNPDNAEQEEYTYGIEIYIPAGADPEYVIPLVVGRLKVKGEVVR